MISVGSRDGRKGIGLGFGVRREMEETELEEGEACSYQDDDPSIDPDVTFSYIDEKIQDVLGHFQKDFEGGVSAENLGAKFGGYGSFLPTYQRSPVWSHPRSPPRAQKYSTTDSPNDLQVEGHRLNYVVSSSAPQVRLESAATGAVSQPTVKAPIVTDLSKRDVCMPSNCAEDYSNRHELVNKFTNPPDQKTLKVRIKVGSDNLSTRKNAEIYSGLGLDVSPSSSFDDSPTESEGLSREPLDLPDESPTSILQIMTSFPVLGGVLLSPLPDDLLCLTERGKCLRDIRSGPFSKGHQDTPLLLGNGSLCVKGDGKVLLDKKTKLVEKNVFSVELENCNNKNTQNGNGVTWKREVDMDTLACEEIVSSTLKLPLLANSCDSIDELDKGVSGAFDVPGEANNAVVKEKIFPDLSKMELSEATPTQEVGWIERPNGKTGSVGKILEDRRANCLNDISVYPGKDGDCKVEKTYDSVKVDSNASKGRKALHVELPYPPKQKVVHKASPHEEDGQKVPIGNELSSSGGKKKPKGSQSHGNPDICKESLRVDASLVLKNKKISHRDNYMPKSETENFKIQKDSGKARDRNRDFFRDMKLEEEGNGMDPSEMPSDDRLRNSEVVEKCTSGFSSGSKERLFPKKTDKPSKSEVCLRAVPYSGNGPNFDAAPPIAAPLVIEENWVCCDKCQKWRLLPIGTNPDHLPEKWLCSMLNWLPGMNRCSISEEETTKALIALYQVPAPESQNNLQSHANGVVSTVTLGDVWHPHQNHQNLSLHNLHGSGKKKHGLKEVSNATNQDGPALFQNSTKKNLPASVKSRSLNDVNQSPSVNELDFQHLSKSGDLAVEKHRHKQKVKHKLLEHHSDEGDMKKLKMRGRKEIDRDCFRGSKKIKTEGSLGTEEDWMSDHVGALERVGPSSSGGLHGAGRDQPKYSDRSSSKDSKGEVRDSLHVSARKTKNKLQVSLDDGSTDVGKRDSGDVVKKRKLKESRDHEIYAESLPGTGNNPHDSRGLLREECSESDRGKEKKARFLKCEEKELYAGKAPSRADNKGSGMKDLGSTLFQRNLDGMDPLKRDLGSLQHSMAATSSSSKVSGSHKTKANFQELKGSPVESVSSSPLRILNSDKPSTAKRSLVGKDDSRDVGILDTNCPRRCSDGEDDDRSDRSRTVRKDKTVNVTHHRSQESSVFDFQDGDLSNLSGMKAKSQVLRSPEFTNHHLTNGEAGLLGHNSQYSMEPQASNQFHDEGRTNDSHYCVNGSRPRKSGKGSSLRSKDNSRSSKSFDNGKIKVSNSSNESQDHAHSYQDKPREGRTKFQEKCGSKLDVNDKNVVGKKVSTGKLLSDSSKRESHSKSGGNDGPDLKVGALHSQVSISAPNQNLHQDRDGEKFLKRFHSEKSDRVDVVSERGKSVPLRPSGEGQNEKLIHGPQLVSGSHKGTSADLLLVDASEGDDELPVAKQNRKIDKQNGNQHTSSRQSTPSGHRARDLDARSPVRRESHSQAATSALKEATNLKHMADRLKNSGSNLESLGLYFQAALKFLHCASLWESGDGSKHGEMIQSIQMYSSTAKLCDFCAHEYEKFKDMAAAALAYKCMEVAYMRVVYSSHSSAGRDRLELQQTALQMAPPGESPSSSASDVDNLNNPPTVDKVALAKGVCSPQVAGNHVIAARNRPHFVRLLNFAQDVNFAMEASRKSHIAFAAANASLEGAQYEEGISSIKRALDFNFQDVEGLLRLVRLAMEAISRG